MLLAARKRRPNHLRPAAERKRPVVVLETRVVTGSGGGPDKTILNSPRFLWEHGYHTLCAYMHPPGDPGFELLREKAKLWQAPLLSIHDRGPWDWKVVAEYLNLCRRERVAIWHGHDYKSNALGIVLARFWPMRLVTTVHGWGVEGGRRPLYYGIDRLCLPWYESVICVSEDLQAICLKAGVPPERCVLIQNGIDTEQFARRQPLAVAKKTLGIGAGTMVVGAAGRLSAEKGYDLLIRAAGRLLEQGLDLQLLIVGEGEERPVLEALIAQLGLAGRVRLLGYRSDVRAVYEAMDVFVLSSLREGLPNVVLEAMAMETPVVATRIAGVPKLIRAGENGLLCAPGSVEELQQSLGYLLTDPDLRQKFRQAGRRTIEKDYSFAVRMGKIRSIYDSLLRGG